MVYVTVERWALLDRRLQSIGRRFDACIHQEAKADKYQTVAFDRNRYSVPRRFAFTTVTIKGYVNTVKHRLSDKVATDAR